jgi:hypothetical protein
VSKSNTSLVLGTGSYSKDGFKNGEFDLYYIDGKPEANGVFKNNLYEGPWVFYYPNGKLACKANFRKGQYDGQCEFYFENGQPYAFMKISGDRCVISDLWLKDGKKIVDKGNGYCSVVRGSLCWFGKLHKGLPDSIWTFSVLNESIPTESKVAKKVDIVIYDMVSSEQIAEIYGSESFMSGQFVKGQNRAAKVNNSYSDQSRIVFLPKTPELRIINSDRLSVAVFSCDGTNYYKKFGKWRVIYFQ